MIDFLISKLDALSNYNDAMMINFVFVSISVCVSFLYLKRFEWFKCKLFSEYVLLFAAFHLPSLFVSVCFHSFYFLGWIYA